MILCVQSFIALRIVSNKQPLLTHSFLLYSSLCCKGETMSTNEVMDMEGFCIHSFILLFSYLFLLIYFSLLLFIVSYELSNSLHFVLPYHSFLYTSMSCNCKIKCDGRCSCKKAKRECSIRCACPCNPTGRNTSPDTTKLPQLGGMAKVKDTHLVMTGDVSPAVGLVTDSLSWKYLTTEDICNSN